MRRYSGGFAGAGSRREAPAWINGWVWRHNAWNLRVLRRARSTWTESVAHPESILKARAFEPSTPGIRILGTENRRFDIPDLSALSPLLEPREILGGLLPKATGTDHAIYAIETGDGRLFLPAWLLVDQLWLWSVSALRAILTPNSLDVFMGEPALTEGGLQLAVSAKLLPQGPNETALHRLTWLALCADARASWKSVITYAYGNRVDLILPRARLTGWLWGAQLPCGLLACELDSIEVTYESPESSPVVQPWNSRACRALPDASS